MFERLEEFIMRHTALMDAAVVATIQIIETTQTRDIRGIEQSTQNRERLINQVAETQGKAEAIINNLPDEDICHENLDIVKAWFEDLTIWSHTVQNLDQYLIDLLNNEKEETTKEIASVFNTKTKFQGYNLKQVNK